MRKYLIRILKSIGLYGFAKAVIGGLRKLTPTYGRQNEEMAKFYSRFIGEGDLCFDIGANIGNRTDVFLKLGARVVAVEPQNNCIAKLKEKYKDNEKVVLITNGLDEKEGQKKMMINKESTLSSVSESWVSKTADRFDNSEWAGEQTILMTTMDDLIKQYGKPKFCKIDVEGYEFNVLKGLTEPIKYISFEFVPEMIGNTIDCINYLNTLGKVIFNYSTGESMELVLNDWVEREEISKILKELPDKKVFGDVYAEFV